MEEKMKDIILTPSQKKKLEYYKTIAKIIKINTLPRETYPENREIQVWMRRTLGCIKWKNQMVMIGIRGGVHSFTKYDDDWNIKYSIDY